MFLRQILLIHHFEVVRLHRTSSHHLSHRFYFIFFLNKIIQLNY